jgi:predicted nucleic acid-binding Zn ribbon protein
MPTYEFRCPDGTIIEKFFKISEVPDSIPSPKGDGDAVRMITGGAGLVFKGSGFYITDYGKDGKKDTRDAAAKTKGDAAKSESSGSTSDSKSTGTSDSTSSTKSETKSDSKPAATEKSTTPAPKPSKD